MSAYRTGREPFNTCPAKWRALLVGHCRACGRPMADKRRMRHQPELSRWFTRALNSTICGSCHWREHTAKHGRPPRTRRNTATEELSPRRIRELRAVLGACIECGWVPGIDDQPHQARRCPAAELEMRNTA